MALARSRAKAVERTVRDYSGTRRIAALYWGGIVTRKGAHVRLYPLLRSGEPSGRRGTNARLSPAPGRMAIVVEAGELELDGVLVMPGVTYLERGEHRIRMEPTTLAVVAEIDRPLVKARRERGVFRLEVLGQFVRWKRRRVHYPWPALQVLRCPVRIGYEGRRLDGLKEGDVVGLDSGQWVIDALGGEVAIGSRPGWKLDFRTRIKGRIKGHKRVVNEIRTPKSAPFLPPADEGVYSSIEPAPEDEQGRVSALWLAERLRGLVDQYPKHSLSQVKVVGAFAGEITVIGGYFD